MQDNTEKQSNSLNLKPEMVQPLPEKVREELTKLPEAEEYRKIVECHYNSHFSTPSWKVDEAEKNLINAQILKLQQAGWGNISKQNQMIITLQERIDTVQAEARQQALKTLRDWGNERCPHFKDTNLHSYPVIYSLKRGCDKCWNEYFEGELPKE
jgi:hypothetical protein